LVGGELFCLVTDLAGDLVGIDFAIGSAAFDGFFGENSIFFLIFPQGSTIIQRIEPL
jgi:hypothetical protein